MANYCSNHVQFQTDSKNFKNFWKNLELSKNVSERTGEGFRFLIGPEIQNKKGYLYDIELDEDEGTMRFETRYSPRVRDVHLVVRMFKVSFEYWYEEMAGSVYGKYKYHADLDILTDTTLSSTELEECKKCGGWKDSEGVYVCKDDCQGTHEDNCESQEDDYEKMEDLLEKKESNNEYTVLGINDYK